MFSNMIRLNFRPYKLLAVALLLAVPYAHSSDAVVAESGGQQLRLDELKIELDMMDPQMRAARFPSEEALGRLAQDYMARRVIAERARAEGLENDVFRQRLKLMEERLLYEDYLNRAEQAAITDQAVQALAREEYTANRSQFVTPEQVRARHILVAVNEARTEEDARDRARIVRARALAGEDFSELAKEYSDDPGSAARGGDLGFFSKGRMVAPFEEAAFALKSPGDVSDVVQSQFGFHVIVLEARQEAGQRSYDEVKEQLEPAVRQRMRQRVRLDILGPIRDPQNMVIHTEALTPLLSRD